MCLYSITFYVVSVALLTIQMESVILCKRQEFIGLKIIFFVQMEVEFTVKRTLFALLFFALLSCIK